MAVENESQSPTESRARELFEASLESLDADARARLARARYAAVEAAESSRRASWRTWVPAAALGASAVVAVLVWRPDSRGQAAAARPSADVDTLESVEMLADGEDLDLVQNDLAFYEWLDADGLASGGSTG